VRYAFILAVGLASLPSAMGAPAMAQSPAPPLAYTQPLAPKAVQTVQERLRQAGVYNGRIDGIWGGDSEAALQRFQQAHQLQVTGQLNQATAATLGLDPNSLLATPATAANPPPPPDRLQPGSVRTLQARLGSLGFYSGPVDGVWGSATETAIENFQRARGLPADGQLGPATVTAMGLTPDVLAYR
jgi:peptidoglycan hydrolase-like protein with peptidoglycan-binding domain